MKYLILLLTNCLTMFLLASCSTSMDIYIDTYSLKISSGVITAYNIEEGSKTTVITSTDIKGSPAKISIGNHSGPILVELSNAVFKDFATDKLVSFSENDRWSNIIISPNEYSSSESLLPINPLTTLITTLSFYKSKYSSDQSTAITKAKDLFNEHFKIDLNNTPLSKTKDLNNELDSQSIQYYLILAGLSQLANTKINDTDCLEDYSNPLNAITNVLKNDISFDGTFNGVSQNGPITICNYNLSSTTLKSDLVEAIETFMINHNIEMSEEIFSLFASLLSNHSELFVSTNGIDFDSPRINLLSPLGLSFINGSANIYIETFDNEEVESINVYVADFENTTIEDIDNISNTFTGVFDTTNYPDGLISIIINATDINGNYAEEAVSFIVDNSPPELTTNLETENIWFARDILNVEIYVHDNGIGLSSIEAKIDDSPIHNIQKINDSLYSVNINTWEYPDGPTSVDINVLDLLGNQTSSENSITINNHLLPERRFIEHNGGITSLRQYSTVFAGDINQDGFDEIVTSRYSLGTCLSVHYSGENFNYTEYENIQIGASCIGETINLAGNCYVNYDDIPDLVVGLPSRNLLSGVVVVFYGPFLEGEWAGYKVLTNDNPFPGQMFGENIACLDLDGNSVDDVIVGMNSETVRIFWGANLIDKSDIYSYENSKIFPVGDTNNDNIDDVIVGSQLILGSHDHSFGVGSFILNSIDSAIPFLDFNEDGYSDFVVGDKDFENANSGSGIAYIVSGEPNHHILRTIVSPIVSDYFAQSLAEGDINGDGYLDIVVGSPKYFQDEGKIFVYLGPDFLEHDYQTINNQSESISRFGQNVISGFDLNKDGLSDVITQTPSSTFDGSMIGSFEILLDN